MKLSVILCVFNDERFIHDAVLSILTQTYRDFEFIIVDDASTDASPDILKRLAQQDTRIHVLTNPTNQGLTTSLNKALAQARGKYIARMDADDIALPNRFEEQFAFLTSHPDVGVVGTAHEWIDERDNIIGRPTIATDSETIRRILPRTNPMLHSSVMIRRSLLEEVGGYDESFSRAQDYDLWLRLVRRTNFVNLPQILMQRRLAKTMVSIKSEREQLRCAVRARLNAIRRGDVSMWNSLYITKPFIASLFPTSLVRWVRIHLFKQSHYAHPSLN